MSTSSDSRGYARFDELAEEFAERYRRGERPALEEYVDRLPEMADEIRELFPAMVEVELAEEQARGEASPSPVAAPPQSQIGDYRIVPRSAGAAWGWCTRPSRSHWIAGWP